MYEKWRVVLLEVPVLYVVDLYSYEPSLYFYISLTILLGRDIYWTYVYFRVKVDFFVTL